MRKPEDATEIDQLSARIGGAALGLLGGGFVGLMLAIVLLVFGVSDAAFPVCLFGGALIGAVSGFVRAEAGLNIAEGAGHLGLGLIAGAARHRLRPEARQGRCLNGLSIVGLVLGLALYLIIRWR